MPSIVDLARGTDLFKGFATSVVESLLYRFNGVKKSVAKNETVALAGLEVNRLFVVVSGRLRVYEKTARGHQIFVREICVGEVLGLWILFTPEITCWPGTVVAAEPSVLISLDMPVVRHMMEMAAPEMARFSSNVSKILAREFFSSWRKMTVMNAPTIEAKIQIYLTELNNETGKTGVVKVPFDRERMAEYFGVTRPALSRSLGHLRDRGLLSWHRNEFRINF
ncbi:MAG: Crp/Fnr family transcriptional regulator [Kiritimatiellae bacterium]|nr:Crp/Fnr family transcriptional regulator [Kiritimatiellia bacterium]